MMVGSAEFVVDVEVTVNPPLSLALDEPRPVHNHHGPSSYHPHSQCVRIVVNVCQGVLPYQQVVMTPASSQFSYS